MGQDTKLVQAVVKEVTKEVAAEDKKKKAPKVHTFDKQYGSLNAYRYMNDDGKEIRMISCTDANCWKKDVTMTIGTYLFDNMSDFKALITAERTTEPEVNLRAQRDELMALMSPAKLAEFKAKHGLK